MRGAGSVVHRTGGHHHVQGAPSEEAPAWASPWAVPSGDPSGHWASGGAKGRALQVLTAPSRAAGFPLREGRARLYLLPCEGTGFPKPCVGRAGALCEDSLQRVCPRACRCLSVRSGGRRGERRRGSGRGGGRGAGGVTGKVGAWA